MLENTRHHSLIAWLHLLALKHFPLFEKFELGSQLRRAAYSVPANIVEGFARRSRRSRLHFLNIAESSLAEAGYCIHAAYRLGYVSEQLRDEFDKDIKGVGAPLAGLVRSTKRDLTLSGIGAVLLLIAVAWFAA